MENKLKIFITGAAGYVGTMLVRDFAEMSEVGEIIGLDKEKLPDLLKTTHKLTYIQQNLAEDGWQDIVSAKKPDIVIHTAWQIREMYGQAKKQWSWNVEGSKKVFKLALELPSVKKLIHFSTVASYSAYPSNTIEHRFTEEEPFRKSDYLYAEEKRISEEDLKKMYDEAKQKGNVPEVMIVRPAAITGPRGRYMRIRFGLQAALSGQLKENFIHRLISAMVSFVPITKKWCRQFIHEDDIAAIVEMLALKDFGFKYETFNLCPPGDVVRGKDMAKAVNKKSFTISPQLIRFAFFWMWHLTRGRVPTSKGGWKSYSYPIVVDGSKITRLTSYEYQHNSLDAFTKIDGKYAKFVNK